MAKYENWEDLMNSGESFLSCLPSKFFIEKGVIVFEIEDGESVYFCSAYETCLSDVYFDPAKDLRSQCDFDGFVMFDKGNRGSLVCKW